MSSSWRRSIERMRAGDMCRLQHGNGHGVFSLSWQMRIPGPKVPVRLLSTPQPYSDETFGSWFRRLAACQHASREELAGALLGKPPQLLVRQPIDWDVHPPEELIERLSRCTTVDRGALQTLIPNPSERLLRVYERNVYCPRCWEEDFRALTVHERRSWLDCWSLRCVKHDQVLRSFKASRDGSKSPATCCPPGAIRRPCQGVRNVAATHSKRRCLRHRNLMRSNLHWHSRSRTRS
jgi:TniQ